MDLPPLAFRPLELLLNRGIGLSTTASSIARELDGRALDVRVRDSGLAARFLVRDGRISVTAPGDTTADATFEGPLSAVLRLSSGDAEAVIRDGLVTMSGNTEVSSRFRDLFRTARPDPEEELSRIVGDSAAHQAGEFARTLLRWGGDVAQSMGRSTGEFLTEERHLLPTRNEVNEFAAEVERLRDDVERAEARLMNLEQGPDRR